MGMLWAAEECELGSLIALVVYRTLIPALDWKLMTIAVEFLIYKL